MLHHIATRKDVEESRKLEIISYKITHEILK